VGKGTRSARGAGGVPSSRGGSSRLFLPTSQFQRMWWSEGGSVARRELLAPRGAPGYAIFGDVAMEG